MKKCWGLFQTWCNLYLYLTLICWNSRTWCI